MMRRTNSIHRSVTFALVGIFIFLAAGPIFAKKGDWLIRVRAINIDPDSDSSAVSVDGTALAGTSVSVDDATVPELDITYMVADNWGVELVLGTAEHDVIGEGGLAALGKIADTRILPPTLVLQYHFAPEAAFRPYVGVGVNYTLFFDESGTDSLAGALGGVSDVKLDASLGFAAQIGADIGSTDRWFFNIDVKYANIETDATIQTGAGTVTVDVDINPIIIGAGVGWRF